MLGSYDGSYAGVVCGGHMRGSYAGGRMLGSYAGGHKGFILRLYTSTPMYPFSISLYDGRCTATVG